jgi:hypothetical protein
MLYTLTPITAVLLAAAALPAADALPVLQSPAAVQAPGAAQTPGQALRAKQKKASYLTPLLLQRASWARSTALFRSPTTGTQATTRASYNRTNNNGPGGQGPQVPRVPAGSATIPLAPQPISIYIP